MRAWLTCGGIALLIPVLAAPAAAQDDPVPTGPPPLTINYVEGRVDVARDTGVLPAQAPDLLDDGDRLITASGRAELVFADGSVIHVDHDTDVRVDGEARLRIVRGHILVRTSAALDGDGLFVGTPAGLVRLSPRGEYDLSASDLDGDTIVGTMRGQAALLMASTEMPVGPEDVLHVDPRDPRPRWTRARDLRSPLGEWAAARMHETTAALRGQPLPPQLAPYAADLADHGQWSTVTPYGPVWEPSVAVGWRPYGNGAWRHTRRGWTWIDNDSWSWALHHYGRWGRHASGGWFWIPQATWGPAWVSWAIGPDHIGWSPLGWDSRPVVDFFVGARGSPTDAWASSWSVVPRQSFGIRGLIGPHLQDLRQLPGPVLGGFVVQSHEPRAAPGAWGAPRMPERRWIAGGASGRARPTADGHPPRPTREPSRGPAAPPPQWARPRDARPSGEASPLDPPFPYDPGRARGERDANGEPDGEPRPNGPAYARPRHIPAAAPAGGDRSRSREGAPPSSTPPPAAGVRAPGSGRSGAAPEAAAPPQGHAQPRGDGGSSAAPPPAHGGVARRRSR